MSAPTPRGDATRPGLDRFLDDLRRTGTVITGPVLGEPERPWSEDDRPVEWLVQVHRRERIDPPYRLHLDEQQFAEVIAHATSVVDALAGEPRTA